MNIKRLEGVVTNKRADMNRERHQGTGNKATCHISNFVEQMATTEGEGLSALARRERIPASTGKREV